MSGGADSLALLLLAHQTIPDLFEVATVDHGLRAESSAEAAMVAGLCADIGVSHCVLKVTVSEQGNLQAAAREARYRALGQWARDAGIGSVATAHHADDQAETLLMRLMRGSGLAGMAAMRARAPMPMAADIGLIRPLLGWRRAELAALVAVAGWPVADDPGNRDTRFDRARLRAALAEAPWLDLAAIARSAAHLRDAADALDWAVTRELAEQVTFTEDGGANYRPMAPRAIRLGVVGLIVRKLGAEGSPRGSEIVRLLETLEAGGIATLGGMRGDGRDASAWRFTPAPPRSNRSP